LSIFEKKGAKPEALAQLALQDENLLQEAFNGVLSKNDVVRQNSFQTLNFLSENNPESVYDKWDFFVNLIRRGNSFHKYIAIWIIANLTKADHENKFEKLFNDYYGLLGDKSVIPAGHVAAKSGIIALAKPQLQTEITKRLLDIDNTAKRHKDLIKSGAIEAFDVYFEKSKDQARIIDFVKTQLNCESPKTRKLAKAFLEKWSKK
jgi:hypothetical protein